MIDQQLAICLSFLSGDMTGKLNCDREHSYRKSPTVHPEKGGYQTLIDSSHTLTTLDVIKGVLIFSKVPQHSLSLLLQ